ncbi:MAG: hypothetical protein LBU58_00850 [Clostridiales bacterium]|jgi:hypothetical protein|nr:hypothetical protein [Clostridiales bacterium]
MKRIISLLLSAALLASASACAPAVDDGADVSTATGAVSTTATSSAASTTSADVSAATSSAAFTTAIGVGDAAKAPVLIGKTADGADLFAPQSLLQSPDMNYEPADSSQIVVKEFNFGEGELKNSLGNVVPCPLDGIIAAPVGASDAAGPYPLVVIFHGVKAIESVYEKVYAGFDYLVAQLAAEGYVVLSFNINVEYDCFRYGESTNLAWAYTIYKQQMALLARANAGDDPGYGIDLAGKIDFDDMHLMGHSRGGEVAEDFIRKEAEEGLDRIRSLFRIETSRLIYDDPMPDVPTGIILGEYDGDMPENGQEVFDEIQRDPGRKSPASIVSLRGANHAYFNRTFSWDDEPKDGRDTEGKLLTRERQEDFIARFAAAFLSVYAKGAQPWGLWDTGSVTPGTMFGCPVTASYYMPGRLSLITVSEAEAARLAVGGDEVEARYAVQEGVYDRILFTHPGGSNGGRALPLFNIRWTAKAGTVSIPCATAENPATDFSGYRALSLYTAVDSSDALNPQGEPQSFTVTLIDRTGAAQSVLVPKGAGALDYYPGYVKHYDADREFSPAYDVWRGYMPLGDLRIPLTYFDQIDLGAVREIVIGLDQTDSGAVMLSGVYLEK